FAEELGISVGFAKGFFQNLYPILRCSGRKNERGTGTPKRALQLNHFAFSFRLGKALDFRQTAEPRVRVLIPFRSFHDRMNVHEIFVEPLLVALEERIGAGGSRVDLTTLQSRVELGAPIGSDELGIIKTEQVSEQTPFVVGRETHRLRPNPNS